MQQELSRQRACVHVGCAKERCWHVQTKTKEKGMQCCKNPSHHTAHPSRECGDATRKHARNIGMRLLEHPPVTQQFNHGMFVHKNVSLGPNASRHALVSCCMELCGEMHRRESRESVRAFSRQPVHECVCGVAVQCCRVLRYPWLNLCVTAACRDNQNERRAD